MTRDQTPALLAVRTAGLEEIFDACEEILIDEIATATLAAGRRFLARWAQEVRERFGIGEPDGPEPDGGDRSRAHLSPVGDRWADGGRPNGNDDRANGGRSNGGGGGHGSQDGPPVHGPTDDQGNGAHANAAQTDPDRGHDGHRRNGTPHGDTRGGVGSEPDSSLAPGPTRPATPPGRETTTRDPAPTPPTTSAPRTPVDPPTDPPRSTATTTPAMSPAAALTRPAISPRAMTPPPMLSAATATATRRPTATPDPTAPIRRTPPRPPPRPHRPPRPTATPTTAPTRNAAPTTTSPAAASTTSSAPPKSPAAATPATPLRC